MLIRYTVENFLSFGERVTFSMIPGLTRSHASHKIEPTEKNGIDLLKLGMVYGANASGKSNLIKSLFFVKDFVLEGAKPEQDIPVVTNKLNSEYLGKPSRFEIEFRKNGKNYAFGIVVNRKKVLEEWLYEISKTADKLIYERRDSKKGESKISFNERIFSQKKDYEFLGFIAKGTRPNQLFLTECYQRNVINSIESEDVISDVLNWFSHNVLIIFPESQFGGLLRKLENDRKFSDQLQKYLRVFDTGIDGIAVEKTNLNQSATVTEELMENIKLITKLTKDEDISSPGFSLTQNESGDLVASQVVIKHQVAKANDSVNFGVSEESDGTQRLIDLIPALIELSKGDMVCFIDEIDRSLHPNLTKRFLEMFIEISGGTGSQLIVTTHDTNLLSLKDFRKDEIWFVEKDKEYQSKLYSLNDYDIRFDKRIQKDYLLGRFGAVPSLKHNVEE